MQIAEKEVLVKKLQYRADSDSRVMHAAKHPKEGVVNPDEYYMVDPPRSSDCHFLANPGNTHVVFYTATFTGDTQVNCHALENWQQVDRFFSDSIRSEITPVMTPEEIVADLRAKADKLEKWLGENPQPPAASFQGMPYAGMKIWVEHPGKPGTLVHVKVTEICVMNGDVSVLTEGWKYFRPGCWFWTKEAAEASLQKT